MEILTYSPCLYTHFSSPHLAFAFSHTQLCTGGGVEEAKGKIQS